MNDPGFLGFGGRLDAFIAVFPNIGDAVRNPLRVLLDAGHHIGEDRRAAGAGDGDGEQIGKSDRL